MTKKEFVSMSLPYGLKVLIHVSAEVREINQGNIEYNRLQMNKNK